MKNKLTIAYEKLSSITIRISVLDYAKLFQLIPTPKIKMVFDIILADIAMLGDDARREELTKYIPSVQPYSIFELVIFPASADVESNKTYSCLVSATSVQSARVVASIHCGVEGAAVWLDERESSCELFEIPKLSTVIIKECLQ